MKRPVLTIAHGFATVVVVLVGVPLALCHLVGLPTTPASSPQTELSALLSWLAWIWCAATVLRAMWRGATGVAPAAHGGLARHLAAVSLATAAVIGAVQPASAHLRGTGERARQPAAVSSIIQASPRASHVVEPGESLWSIAVATYGSGTAWDRIAQANLGRIMGDGRRFTDPSLIFAGWVLALPRTEPPIPHTQSQPDALTKPAPSRVVPEVTASTTGQRVTVATQSSSLEDHVVVAVLGPLGLAVIAAALRRRRMVALTTDEEPATGASDDAVCLARVVVERSDPILSGRLDAALDAVAPVLLEQAPNRVHFARVTAHELVIVTPAIERGPTHIGSADGDGNWIVPLPLETSDDLGQHRCSQMVAIALAADGDGTWVALCGPSSMVKVGGDNRSVVADMARLCCEARASTGGPPVLTSMAPTVVDDTSISAICFCDGGVSVPGVVTVAVVGDDQDCDVHADRDLITLRTARVRFAPEAAVAVTRAGFESIGQPSTTSVVPHTAPALVTEISRPMIRLLSSKARIDGLVQPLDPARARRAVEVAAYLGCHSPEAVSVDRLRSRVLGTSEHDASAKTVANLVSLLRRSLGEGSTGLPLLPSAGQGGYRLSAEVEIDVAVVARLLGDAATCTDPTDALGRYHAGFALIDAAPLDDELSGYDWFSAEGHRQHLAYAVITAAERAVELAIASDATEVAAFIIERAALLNPYSERLCRAKMTLAAHSGEPSELQAIYLEHCHRLRTLDPTATPSEVTNNHRAALLDSVRSSVD